MKNRGKILKIMLGVMLAAALTVTSVSIPFAAVSSDDEDYSDEDYSDEDYSDEDYSDYEDYGDEDDEDWEEDEEYYEEEDDSDDEDVFFEEDDDDEWEAADWEDIEDDSSSSSSRRTSSSSKSSSSSSGSTGSSKIKSSSSSSSGSSSSSSSKTSSSSTAKTTTSSGSSKNSSKLNPGELISESQRRKLYASKTNPKMGTKTATAARSDSRGYHYADFSTYNSYNSTNHLGGTPIYLLGTVMDIVPFTQSRDASGVLRYRVAILVNDCDGYQWYLRLFVDKNKLDSLKALLNGKSGYLYGGYAGYSGVLNRPMMDATVFIDTNGFATALSNYY